MKTAAVYTITLLAGALGLSAGANAATSRMAYDDAASAADDQVTGGTGAVPAPMAPPPAAARIIPDIPAASGMPPAAVAAANGPGGTGPADARPVMRYGDLSALEEPLAIKLGRVTLTISGTAVLAGQHDFGHDTAVSGDDVKVAGNAQIEMQEKFSNRVTAGVIYNAQITSDSGLYNSVCTLYCNTYAGGHRHYNDDFVGYARSSWGTVFAGNVGNLVRNDTRRRAGYGETTLGQDDFLGQLSRWGAGYQVRLGASMVSAVADQDGNFELGESFQRPIGTHDIRLTARLRDAAVQIADGLGALRSVGLGAVGDVTYGSSIYDLGLGFERMSGRGLGLDRWFVSSGARTKLGLLAVSAEAHYGQIDSSPERSASLGLAYALARGLSVNLGLNYSDANVVRHDIVILQPNTKSATASVRYGF